jgi:hypothetical protein
VFCFRHYQHSFIDRKNAPPSSAKSAPQEAAATPKKSEKKNIPAKSDQVFEHLEKFLATT